MNRPKERRSRTQLEWASIATAFVTAIAAAGAMFFSGLNLKATDQQLQVTEQGQITDRFGKAIDQLGSPTSVDVRIGAIYELERLTHDSPPDQPAVVDILSTFIREHAPQVIPNCTQISPAPDVQVALTVLGRRVVSQDGGAQPDLDFTCLANAHLMGGIFERVRFDHAILSGADFTCADLAGADFYNARLDVAQLGGNSSPVHLNGANLTNADLKLATLTEADLQNAPPAGTHESVHGCTPPTNSTNLTGVKLGGTDLTRANLTGVTVTLQGLNGATLTGAVGIPH
jgi:hypothetical protein